MIKMAIQERGLEIKVKSLISDYEIGIITAAEETFEGVEMRGCLFHYRQVNIIIVFLYTADRNESFCTLVAGCVAPCC